MDHLETRVAKAESDGTKRENTQHTTWQHTVTETGNRIHKLEQECIVVKDDMIKIRKWCDKVDRERDELKLQLKSVEQSCHNSEEKAKKHGEFLKKRMGEFRDLANNVEKNNNTMMEALIQERRSLQEEVNRLHLDSHSPKLQNLLANVSSHISECTSTGSTLENKLRDCTGDLRMCRKE